MFRCQTCNKQIGPNERENKIITETRPRNYYTVVLKHRTIKHLRYEQFTEKDERALEKLEQLNWKKIREKYSKGHEIIKEQTVCGGCYETRKK